MKKMKMKVKKKKKSFPDMSGDGKVTKKDILILSVLTFFSENIIFVFIITFGFTSL